MSFTNCENMTAYATNEYALNTSLSKFKKVIIHCTELTVQKLPLSRVI